MKFWFEHDKSPEPAISSDEFELLEPEPKYCPKCNIHRFGRDWKYCRTCGTVLVPAPPFPKCLGCGKPLSENDSFCPVCGRKIE